PARGRRWSNASGHTGRRGRDGDRHGGRSLPRREDRGLQVQAEEALPPPHRSPAGADAPDDFRDQRVTELPVARTVLTRLAIDNWQLESKAMAHKKGVGSSRNGRDSRSQRLGVKRSDGQLVRAGTIVVRQRGTQFWVGNNVGIGKDHTIYAKIDGVVKFEPISRNKRRISVYPTDIVAIGGGPAVSVPADGGD